MAEKITFDDATGAIAHSVTLTQKDMAGADVVNESRTDHYGSGVIAARCDPAFEAKLSVATRKKITDFEAAINARAEAEAAARIEQQGGM